MLRGEYFACRYSHLYCAVAYGPCWHESETHREVLVYLQCEKAFDAFNRRSKAEHGT